MITWHTYDENTYKTTRYNLLYWVEETGNPSTTPYIDTKNYPTMGIGFNLTVSRNLSAILTEMGFDLSATGTEGQYITNLRNAVSARNLQRLDTIMNQWANDATVTTHNGKDKRSTFFLGYNEINNVFNAIAPYYEALVDKWIAKYGLTVERYSRERAIFYSLAYNSQDKNKDGIPDLLGPGLGNAIKNGNRAEAWFEIRYGSNGDKLPGIAKRRYYESDLFGLYNTPGSVDEAEAKTIMRMYTLHKAAIYKYDVTDGYGAQVAQANHDYQVIWVGTLEYDLNIAKNYLITNFALGKTIDGEVIVGKGLSSYEYKDQGKYIDQLVGTDKNDLIFGERGDDVIIGGKGNDVLYGGEGNDTYKIYSGDGIDTIEDKEGINTVILCGQELKYFYTPDGTYFYNYDKTLKAEWQQGDLVVTYVDPITQVTTKVILNEDFQWGDFGITLTKPCPPIFQHPILRSPAI